MVKAGPVHNLASAFLDLPRVKVYDEKNDNPREKEMPILNGLFVRLHASGLMVPC